MARGEGAQQVKVHFKGKTEDFVIFLEDAESAEKWKTDKTIPLTQVVNSFKVFITHKHGAQGPLDTASKQILDNEFGSTEEEEAIKQIIEKGTIQETEAGGRQGVKNESMGPRGGH